jgi:hypothetical protein
MKHALLFGFIRNSGASKGRRAAIIGFVRE